jgi:two-component system chemotaxis response regulator CheB
MNDIERPVPESLPQLPHVAVSSWQWLAIGASTGGPTAVRELLAELPSPLPLRVVIVQHIGSNHELALADWLAGVLELDVGIAVDGEQPPAGSVRLAPAGAHLWVAKDGRLALDRETPAHSGHRPSVDELFLSLAATVPRQTAAVLLTGMGRDGAEGLAALRNAGACCLAQDEASSAVFGMPGAALALDAAELFLSPSALGRELARRLAKQA